MSITAVNMSFRHEGAEKDTLQGLTFTIPEGALYCLAGTNGSGKSTLLHILAGVFSPETGTLQVTTRAPSSKHISTQPVIALVPQEPDLYILGSIVREDLLLGLDPKDTEAQQRAFAIAEELGLGSVLDSPVHILSYGQKRKLCLASALSSAPHILLLDEPFAGLDYPTARAMCDVLRNNKSAEVTQVIASHELELVADDLDGFILLKDGRLVYSGPVQDSLSFLEDAEVRPPCWWLTESRKKTW